MRKFIAVDDSEIARELIKATLADFGYHDVSSFGNPKEALESMSASEVAADLVLLDVMMPEMDGVELCARIRALDKWRDVPIVMLTSREDKSTLSRAFMAGANDYLTKPFDRIEFQARLRAQLRLKAELDRRKSSGPRSARASRRARSQFSLPGLLADRDALQDALAQVSDERLDGLGVFALSVDATARNTVDFSTRERQAILAAVAEVLAQVRMPAGNMLAHWEGDTFCGASLVHDDDALLADVRDLAMSVKRALESMPGKLKGALPGVSVGVTLPGTAGTVSEALGKAFGALEEQAQKGGNGIKVAGASQRNH
ncbi:response regulator [Salipiger bermudensis]|uniref:Diguanylate cyclase n=1 Tax=Salipiger bermudensis (strain DSM 26914 / JCM 13377 / KCTC 12554 / HTCC2601) TaxID=314265 RepID=Q0FRZ0_SALBH|nr:response regulator [Salipiger bermudensis]EAU46969.1 diguanylate cyclase [Salipiger bermudensis HTCC2601]